MGAGRSLPAWGKRGRFTYAGDLTRGTRIQYGRGGVLLVPPSLYAELLAHFGGKEVDVGLSRNPPRHSLGSWLKARLHGTEVPVAYVGPILVAEGAVERMAPDRVAFRTLSTSGP